MGSKFYLSIGQLSLYSAHHPYQQISFTVLSLCPYGAFPALIDCTTPNLLNTYTFSDPLRGMICLSVLGLKGASAMMRGPDMILPNYSKAKGKKKCFPGCSPHT
jgi:hypothetical protein